MKIFPFVFTMVSLLACSEMGFFGKEKPSDLNKNPQPLKGCTAVDTQGLTLGDFKPKTEEGRLYQQAVRLVQNNLKKEAKILGLSSRGPAKSPGNLQQLLAGRVPDNAQQEELDKLRASFTKEIEELTQDYGYYNGNLRLVFRALPTALIEGKASAEQQRIAHDIAVLAMLWQASTSSSDRAAYSSRYNPWPEGKVVYTFDKRDEGKYNPKLLADLREQVRWAARLWEEETDGVVTFIEADELPASSVVSDFLYGPRYNLVISFRGLGNYSGMASVGYYPFADAPYQQDGSGGPYNNMLLEHSFLSNIYEDGSICPDCQAELEKGRDGLRHTALHEFGHVLGLRHEHERPERDQYLADVSGDIMQPKPLTLVENWALMEVGPFIVSLPYMQNCSDKTTLHGSPFDYFSVMHYPLGTATKRQAAEIRLKRGDGTFEKSVITVEVGDYIGHLRLYVGQKAFLSPHDIAIVKQMYGGVF